MNKVLIITSGGMPLYTLRNELIEELIEARCDVVLSYPDDAYRNEFAGMGCRSIRLDIDGASINPLKDIKILLDCIKLIRSERPNVVLLYTIKPCIYGGLACALYSVPSIATVTGVSKALLSKNKIISTIATVLSRLGYSKSEVVFFQNESNEQFFSDRKIALGKHSVVKGSGVNLSKHPYEKYPENDGRIKLLYIGRFLKRKGLEEFACALGKAQVEKTNIVCKVVGQSCDNLPVLEDAVERGIIEKYAQTDDVNNYLRWCDALVMPSHAEGMSNVMLEAAATGRPSLASNIPGCREIIEEGKTGFLFEAGSSEAIYRAIMRFAQMAYEEREQMGARAREKMVREFDRAKVVKQYMKVISKYIVQ